MLSAFSSSVLAFHAPIPVANRPAVRMMAEKSTALPFQSKPEMLDGSMVGDVGFDPLGLSAMGVPLTWMREAEIKHGRVCMLGVVGWLAVDSGLRAPGAEKFTEITSFTAHDATVASGNMLILLIACGVFEIAGFAGIKATLAGDRVPGDFMLTGGFGKNPEQLDRLRLSEIKHCRLAMMAFSGIVTQCGLTNGEVGFPYF